MRNVSWNFTASKSFFQEKCSGLRGPPRQVCRCNQNCICGPLQATSCHKRRKSLLQGRFLIGSQIAWKEYKNFRTSCENHATLDFRELIKIATQERQFAVLRRQKVRNSTCHVWQICGQCIGKSVSDAARKIKRIEVPDAGVQSRSSNEVKFVYKYAKLKEMVQWHVEQEIAESDFRARNKMRNHILEHKQRRK